MRIYLVETKSGGKVRASFENGEIYEVFAHAVQDVNTDNTYTTGNYILSNNSDICDRLVSGIYLKNQGCTGQKYAIEITDVREEHISIGEALSRCTYCQDKNDCLQCPYFDNPMYLYRWDESKIIIDSIDKVIKTPQSFQYIKDPYNLDKKAVLLPIHKKWLDMILSGKKKYEFRNVLPKALRGAVA